MRIASLVFWAGLMAPALLACGGRSYRLGGESESEPDAGAAAGSGGQAGFAGSGGNDSGGFAGEGGSAGEPPTTIVDVDNSTPLVRDGVVRIISEELVGVSFVAADEDRIYFNNWAGSVWSAHHDGSGRALLAETEAYHLAVDATHVYWAKRAEIFRVPKDGGTVELVVTLEPNPATFAMWLSLNDSHVYASTYGGQNVVRARKTGSTYEIMARTVTTTGGVALGERAVYFADYTSSSGGLVQSRDLTSPVTGMVFRSGAAMMLTAGSDLWLTHPGGNFDLQFALARVPLDGGGATGYRAATHSFFFASDENHIYWFRNGILGRISRSNGRDQAVAQLPQGEPQGLAITRQWVFVADGTNPGGIFRVPKPAP